MSDAWEQDAPPAFVEDLFAAHHGEIYAYLFRMLRDPELAADLTQDAFVKAYRNYDTLEKPENARAWLYQIAHRVALDHIRRQKIVRFLPWTGESHGAAPSDRAARDGCPPLVGDLQRALERIPERQRAALLLAELHDLTGLELAAALGVSHVAARALLTRARESLRQALAAERDAEAAEDVEAEAGPPRTDPPRRPMSSAAVAARTTGPRRTPAPSRTCRTGWTASSSRSRRAWLDDHLADCADCRTVAAAYEAQRLELRALRDPVPAAPGPVGPDRGSDRTGTPVSRPAQHAPSLARSLACRGARRGRRRRDADLLPASLRRRPRGGTLRRGLRRGGQPARRIGLRIRHADPRAARTVQWIIQSKDGSYRLRVRRRPGGLSGQVDRMRRRSAGPGSGRRLHDGAADGLRIE